MSVKQNSAELILTPKDNKLKKFEKSGGTIEEAGRAVYCVALNAKNGIRRDNENPQSWSFIINIRRLKCLKT